MSMPIWLALAFSLVGCGDVSNGAGAGTAKNPAHPRWGASDGHVAAHRPQATGPCREIQKDMTSGEECLITPGTLESVYMDIIGRRLVGDSDCLLRELPPTSMTVNGCKNKSGLLRVKYVITSGSAGIDLEYAGGISVIELEQKAEGVRRKISHSAD